MACHLLGDLQLTAVLQVGGDTGGPEAMGADLGAQAGGFGSPLNHHVHVDLGQGSATGQLAMAQGRKERGLGLVAQSRDGDPFLKILVQVVMTGKFGHLAALLAEPNPAAALLDIEVLNLHANGHSDASESCICITAITARSSRARKVSFWWTATATNYST